MSVVGIDFGNINTVIAVARNRGIDVITNEVSNRATPSLVSFGPKCRFLGEAAKTQEISHYKNTVASIKRLAGRSFSDPVITEIEKQFITAQLVDVKGQVGAKVQYLGQEQTFTATQLIAMFLDKVKDITANELKIPVSDCVISVPSWFNEIQRRSIIDAAEIAGLNTLRLINDTTASALGYGITKTDLPEDKPRYVAFVDIGHSNYQVSIVAFQKGQLIVKGQACDQHFGGRNFDEALVNHFAKVFKEKYKIDIKSNQKAVFRTQTQCERLKKVLSANAQAPINIESIMNDIDVSAILKREEFEELITDLLDRVHIPLENALTDAGLSKDDLDSIEMIGGTTRIPAIKNRIQKFFGKQLSFTLNQDEAVARGCAFACAMLSPVFRVRDFSITDIQAYPIKVTWDAEPGIEEDTELVVFPAKNPVPSTKILTFHRKKDFALEASYVTDSGVGAIMNPWLGRYTIKKVRPNANGDYSVVKVKQRINASGVLTAESAYMLEEIEKEEEEGTKEQQTPVPMDTDKKDGEEKQSVSGEDANPPANIQPSAKKVKKIQNKVPLDIVVQALGLDSQTKQQFREIEGQMAINDKLVADTEEAKNAFEEYVYYARGQLDTNWADFVTESDKAKLHSSLTSGEDWLYSEEGEDASKSTYHSKLAELKTLGDPAALKFKEMGERPKAVKALRETINGYMSQATGGEERFDHIQEDQKEKVIGHCAEVQKWLDDKVASQAEKSKTDPLAVTSSEIYKKREDLTLFASPIMSRPKPKPKVESPPPEQTSGKEGGSAAAEPMDTEQAQNAKPSEMDVD